MRHVVGPRADSGRCGQLFLPMDGRKTDSPVDLVHVLLLVAHCTTTECEAVVKIVSSHNLLQIAQYGHRILKTACVILMDRSSGISDAAIGVLI